MGWSFGWNTKAALVDMLLANRGGNCEIKAHALRGHKLWVQMQDSMGKNFIVLFRLQGYRETPFAPTEWGYKTIEDACGPCEYDPPKYMLDACEPHATEGSYARQWYRDCRTAAALKRGKGNEKFIAGLKPNDTFLYKGQLIKFLYRYTTRRGAERIAGRPERGGTFRYAKAHIEPVTAAA